MVDAQGVVELELEGDAPQPPGVAVLLHCFPTEQRVAPQLAVGGEGVGGAARHLNGQAVFVQLELLRVGPHVGAVQRHIDGQVSDNGHAFFVGVLLQPPPLPEEKILHLLPECNLPGVFFPGLFQSAGPAQAQLLGPLQPGEPAVVLLQSHEQGVILQPVRLLRTEICQAGRVLSCQAPAGYAEHRVPHSIQQPVVHPLRVAPPVQGLILRRFQQAVPGQQVQVNQVGVAREGGEGLVRGVAVAGGAQGQDLPAGLPPCRQKVHKSLCFRPQGANAPGGGKGEDGHQDSRVSQGWDPLSYLFRDSGKHLGAFSSGKGGRKR